LRIHIRPCSYLIELCFEAAHVAAQVLTLLTQPWHALDFTTGTSNSTTATGTIAATATVAAAAIAVVGAAVAATVAAAVSAR
jgi:hypothetical protein